MVENEQGNDRVAWLKTMTTVFQVYISKYTRRHLIALTIKTVQIPTLLSPAEHPGPTRTCTFPAHPGYINSRHRQGPPSRCHGPPQSRVSTKNGRRKNRNTLKLREIPGTKSGCAEFVCLPGVQLAFLPYTRVRTGLRIKTNGHFHLFSSSGVCSPPAPPPPPPPCSCSCSPFDNSPPPTGADRRSSPSKTPDPEGKSSRVSACCTPFGEEKLSERVARKKQKTEETTFR